MSVVYETWNIRGLQVNREEINIRLSNFNPILVSLQETFLKPNKSTAFNNCSSYYMCMTARLDVTPKTAEQSRIVRTGKSEAEVTNNKN